MSSKSVIVIGGGLAGLSAAVALAESGYRITLLEKRPFLGGRATSYVLPTGEHVDNCQHVTLGCCTNLDDFYRRAGSAGKIRFYDRLEFSSPDGHRGTMYKSPLPAPLHLTPSFLRFPLLNWADKRGIARLLGHIVRQGGRPREIIFRGGRPSMLDWLKRHKQTDRAISRFWGPVLVSALNEQLDQMDPLYGADVFWKGFLANRVGYRIGIPSVPLANLYDGCRDALIARGGEVRMRAAVRRLELTGGAVSGVSFDSGEILRADHYVAAVPQDAFPDLLPADVIDGDLSLRGVRKLKASPITGVHFWFDRQVMIEPFLSLFEMTTQWIFNKSLLFGAEKSTADTGQYLQLVISASYELIPRSREEIVDLCLTEVRRVLPAAQEAKLLKSTVIKETLATFSPSPGCDINRPIAKTSIQHLFLAGDWTATGWPATMEGAVRSGYLAAEAITSADGYAQTFIRPDLPVEGISRVIAKRK